MEDCTPSWMTRRITYKKRNGRADFKLHLGVFRMDSQGAEKLAAYEDIGSPLFFKLLVEKYNNETEVL